MQRVWGIGLLALLLAASGGACAQAPAPFDAVALRGLRIAPVLAPRAGAQQGQNPAFLLGNTITAAGDGVVTLEGAAQVRRSDAVLKGDTLTYDRNTGDVRVRGHGLMLREASIVTGPAMDYNLERDTGAVDKPTFWLSSGASGEAREAQIFSRSRMRMFDTVYAGCPCPAPAWWIESTRVDFDNDENEGVARNAVVYFKGVPILASPYFRFPLRRERKSGFLLPVYGTSTRSGFELAVPYYINLAPNYDATLTPRYFAKRGTQLGGEFRYLNRSYRGEVSGTYLPKDQQAGIKRWLLDARHQHTLGGGFSANATLLRVSDDDYYRDFSTLDFGELAESNLSSSASLNWSGYRYFSAGLTAQIYQALQDRDLPGPAAPPHYKLPELQLRAARYDWGGFDLVSENTLTRFYMPRYHGTIYPNWDPAWLDRRMTFGGTRLSSYNSIAWPLVRAAWYVTPKAALHASHYSTNWYADELPFYAGRARSASRAVPLLSLDTGLTFERDTTLFGAPSLQTLEPRLYYLRVPYREQKDLPTYDTALASFNFAQAFDENIYTGGWDRIADANQLTVGLTTRWLDADSGFQRVSLSAAQRFYFSEQRVTLYNDNDTRTAKRSDYLLGVNAALTNTLSLNFNTQFHPETHESSRIIAGMRWEPKRLASLSLSYRYDAQRDIPFDARLNAPPDARRDVESVMFAGQWPITSKIYVLGRFDYSVKERRSTQSIWGLEYKGDCCWVARVVTQRYAVSLRDVNTALFLQLELIGLGGLGADPMRVLRERVTGYQPVTQIPANATVFERYE